MDENGLLRLFSDIVESVSFEEKVKKIQEKNKIIELVINQSIKPNDVLYN